MGERQHKKYDRFGHRMNDCVRCDEDRYVSLCASCEIDVIIANATAADRAETFNPLQRVARDSGFQRDDHVILAELRRHIFRAVFLQELVGEPWDALE